MSSWDGHRIVSWKAHKARKLPLVVLDCGCCNGLQWGGEEPRECHTCNGSTMLFWNPASGRLRQWPNGPFAGRLKVEDARHWHPDAYAVARRHRLLPVSA